jgi:hypothetical protein
MKKKEVEKRKSKTVGASLTAVLAVLLVILSITPVAMAKNVNSLHLNTIPGTYVDVVDDAWLSESWVTTTTTFELEIINWNAEDIYHMYLLVAADRDPAGIVTANVGGSGDIVPYGGTILPNGKALEPNTGFEFPGHGIYNDQNIDTHFAVVDITDFIPNGVLCEGVTMTVSVVITTSSPIRVHFDAVGADGANNAVACNPGSEDVTYNEIPEFSTIAIPVAAIFGLLFFFNHRKRRESK